MIDWVLKKSGCAIKVEMGRTLDRVGPVHAAHGRYKRVGPVHAALGQYKRVGPVHAARGRYNRVGRVRIKIDHSPP